MSKSEIYMELDSTPVPTVAQYVAAFRAIHSRITENQKKMLQFHHRAPGHVVSATLLANDAGFDGYGGANLQYGLLANELLKQLGIDLQDRVKVGILVEFVDPQFAANQEFLWVMRANVVHALEHLELVPRRSHLLYSNEGE
jgi:hypothetical protein